MMTAFWSPVKDEYVSAAAVLTALTGCADFNCKVVLTENYVGQMNIGHCLFGDAYNRIRKEYDRYQSGYYERGDSFLKFLKRETGKSVAMGRTLEIVHEKLFFLPLNQSLRSDIFEYGFEREFADILEYCEAKFDFLFLNTQSHGNLSTKTVLDAADQVVVCLPTAEWILDILMEKYAGVLTKSTLFFHGDPDSAFLRRMRRKYPAFREQMRFLPVSEELKEAIREGRLADYFSDLLKKAAARGKPDAVLQKFKYLAFSVMRRQRHDTRLKYEDMRALFTERNTDPFSHYSFPGSDSAVAESSFLRE